MKESKMKKNPDQIWILLSTLYEGGGAEIQARMEFAKWKEDGYPAYFLTFDPGFRRGESKEKNHINLTSPWTESSKRCLENIDSPELVQDTCRAVKYIWRQCCRETTVQAAEMGKTGELKGQRVQRGWLRQRKQGKQGKQQNLPTLILHLHNITYAFPSICRALQKIRKEYPGDCVIIQTIHDCRIVCDKGTRLLPDGTFCQENSFQNCFANCMRKRQTDTKPVGEAGKQEEHLNQITPGTLKTMKITNNHQKNTYPEDGRKQNGGKAWHSFELKQLNHSSLLEWKYTLSAYMYWRYRLRNRIREEKARKKTMGLLIVPSICLTELVQKHGYQNVVHIPNMVDVDEAVLGSG